ncbi:ABC transporter permease [Cohnella zeiphila]|uniref:ABC transporter permease n=1 Tax=Cohnella zeiphila TaxID=2761120 RepID=A0A7X0SKG0_9BACL|nr:ABC transporter permease [Cohnella zeiphila]MBB6731642.1 ABC transporter permease [Cohnella zeiphila]
MALSIAMKEWKLLLKEKGTFFWLLLMPVLFIILFGSVFSHLGSSSISLPYIDLDRTQASQSFLDSLAQKSGFRLEAKDASTLDDQVDRIRNGKMSSLLVIPQGFADEIGGAGGKQASVELYSDSSSNTVAAVRASLENVANDLRETKIDGALKAAGENVDQRKQALASPLLIDDKPQNATAVNTIAQVVPGYTVMFVFYVTISMIRRFLGDKSSGMTARLRTTRLAPLNYLLGMWLAYMVVALAQCAVLLGFGHFVYGLELGNVAAIVVLVILLALCGTGIGLALCMLVRGENQGMAFTQLVAMGGAVLGGLWFPAELMPKTMRTISHFIPQYWAQSAFQDIMLRGAHLGAILPSLGVLAAFAAAGLLVALLRFRGFMKSAMS